MANQPLTESQRIAGIHQARRIVNEAAGFHFGGVLTPFAPEFKSLAIRALEQTNEERQRQYDENVNRIAAQGQAEMERDLAMALLREAEKLLDEGKPITPGSDFEKNLISFLEAHDTTDLPF